MVAAVITTRAADSALCARAADAAADAMALTIQQALGVQTGDVAGHFFTGPLLEELANVARAYLRTERAFEGA
jgi:hypothetical protein